MAKLDDISKKEIFKVPDGYFDGLPMRIQARAAVPERAPGLSRGWQLALACLLPLVVAAVIFLRPSKPVDPEALLASVATEDLIGYLQESGLTTDDLLDQLEFSVKDLHAIEDEVYDLTADDFDLPYPANNEYPHEQQ